MHISKLYEQITAKLIAELEAGTVPWTKPWKSTNLGNGIFPINFSTKRYYSGINVLILWFAREEHGYPSPQWITYKQARELGGHVRKGERGTTIVFTKKYITGEGDDERKVSFLKTWTVFNLCQIEGLGDDHIAEPSKLVGGDTPAQFVDATQAEFRAGDQPMYVPSMDFITMPPVAAFENEGHYYATKLHELIHWSGAKKRLDRDMKSRFGTKEYAAEELVAELGAAFLCAHLGIKGELRHADYLANWLELLREDDRAIFTASSKASVAADYLRSFSEQIEQAA